MTTLAKNPYASNNQLSSLEQEVLWEYAKLNDKIRRISVLAKETAENPNASLLAELRDLEKKMGLVLTLFKASVWAVMVEQEADAEAEAAVTGSHTLPGHTTDDNQEGDSLEDDWR